MSDDTKQALVDQAQELDMGYGDDPTGRTSRTSGALAKQIAQFPPHIRAGLDAYRAALNKRQDWHRAVAAAIEAADAARVCCSER